MSNSNPNKVSQLVAQIISVLLHPVFMPLIAALMLYYFMPLSFSEIENKVTASWLLMLVINTIVYPLLTIALLKGLGFIKSIYLKDVKERVIPLIGIMVFYFWAYWVVHNMGVAQKSDLSTELTTVGAAKVPIAAHILLLGNFWGIIALFIVTIFMKVSMHSAGVASLVGFTIIMMLLSASFMPLALAIALAAAALVGWARYAVGAHSAKELWLGYGIGIAAQIGAYLYII